MLFEQEKILKAKAKVEKPPTLGIHTRKSYNGDIFLDQTSPKYRSSNIGLQFSTDLSSGEKGLSWTRNTRIKDSSVTTLSRARSKDRD